MKRHLKININNLIIDVRLARSGTLDVTKADFIKSHDLYWCLKKLSVPTEPSPLSGAIRSVGTFLPLAPVLSQILAQLTRK